MKKTIRTSRSAGYLEKMFRQLNTDSFGGELEEPIITIMSTPGAYGHMTVGTAWKVKEDRKVEINISSDWLDRPIEEVVATLLHEMSHLLNYQRGIQDCSRGGTYHNRKFAEEAERHMLKIDKHDKYGWTITSPTETLLEYIILQGWEDFQMSRSPEWASAGTAGGKTGGRVDPKTGKIKPKGSNSIKHTCPSCGAIARTTKAIPLICGACIKVMEVEL